MRPGIRRVLESRASHIVQFYTQRDGRPNDAAYFDNLARTLATLAGETYGHSGKFDQLMHIGNVCIPAARKLETKSSGNPTSAAKPEKSSTGITSSARPRF